MFAADRSAQSTSRTVGSAESARAGLLGYELTRSAAGIVRGLRVHCCASWCQLQTGALGKYLNLKDHIPRRQDS